MRLTKDVITTIIMPTRTWNTLVPHTALLPSEPTVVGKSGETGNLLRAGASRVSDEGLDGILSRTPSALRSHDTSRGSFITLISLHFHGELAKAAGLTSFLGGDLWSRSRDHQRQRCFMVGNLSKRNSCLSCLF